MSKLFKGIGKVFKKVVKGIGKVVKKIAKSKIFKIVAIAAAVYFGGAGLMSMANGGTFGAGVSSAAGSLSSAGSSLMSGNFSQAGSTFANSWGTAANTGTLQAGGMSANAAVTQAGNMAAGETAVAGGNAVVGAPGSVTPQATFTETVTTPSVVAQNGGQAVVQTTGGQGAAASQSLLQRTGEFMTTPGGGLVASTALKSVGSYASQRDAEKEEKERRQRMTYYGVNGYSQGDSNVPDFSLMTRPVQQAPVISTTDDLAKHYYG